MALQLKKELRPELDLLEIRLWEASSLLSIVDLEGRPWRMNATVATSSRYCYFGNILLQMLRSQINASLSHLPEPPPVKALRLQSFRTEVEP